MPIVVGASFALILILGCGFSGQTCTGEMAVNGKIFRGIAKDKEQAKSNTCSKYCIEGDPETEAMYRIWYDSLSEQEKKRVRKKPEEAKWDAFYKSGSIKKHVESCQQKCLKEAASGDRSINVKCE